MFHFCFNDCLPKDIADDQLVAHLSTTLKHFNKVKRSYPDTVQGIATDRSPRDIVLNQNQLSLEACIKYLHYDLRKLALQYFTRYPVDIFFDKVDYDQLLGGGYIMKINKTDFDAINAKLVQENGGILFTLPLHNDLCVNKLVICDKEESKCEIVNQFGHDSNTDFILEYIKLDIIERSQGFGKLIAILGDCSYDSRFARDFNSLTSTTQNFLLKELEYAISRGAKTRFYPDDKLIKDVTPADENEISIFELRIFSPVATRMYFYESPKKIYLGSIKGKPKDKKQTNDILSAASTIKQLRMRGL